MRTLAEDLVASHGASYPHYSVEELTNTDTSGTSPPQRRPHRDERPVLPGRLTVRDLEQLGYAPADGPAPQPSGTPLGLTSRRVGIVTHEQPPRPGEIALVERVDLEALSRCPQSAAIVSERGSPLSHAAVIARERGVALVLGAYGARRAFSPSQRIAISLSGALSAADEGNGESSAPDSGVEV